MSKFDSLNLLLKDVEFIVYVAKVLKAMAILQWGK